MDFLYWITALVLIGIGIFRIIKPEESIYIRDHWRFTDCEPSEHYIKMERLTGIGYILLAAAIIFVISIT